MIEIRTNCNECNKKLMDKEGFQFEIPANSKKWIPFCEDCLMRIIEQHLKNKEAK